MRGQRGPLVKLGGKVAVGTDAMRMEIQPEVAGMPLWELRLLHEAGLSVDEVIDAATINAARSAALPIRWAASPSVSGPTSSP